MSSSNNDTTEKFTDEEREEYVTKYLSLIDQYMNIYKNDLIPNIKSGHFNMAATRLNMGAEYLGLERIPNQEDILKSKIHLNPQTLEVMDFENVSSHFQTSSQQQSNNSEDVKQDDSSSGVRKRKPNTLISTTAESTDSDLSSISASKLSASVEENLKRKNPIYWFGTLQLSEDLVQAQLHFVNAVKSILELGKIVKEMNELEQQKHRY
ncbi:hypothetical protein FDP41_010879 [Naegleria fowleri]|uniref:Vacuolar ATPase assembly protein VMA22 n=1 Tax=Naegleria fowleri TaxID=5763 RepID=A0A6A5CB71_NAEFO|nr:uncharacterized protein FDP41_010879 [Naegleria fowleri]KAF0982900.1 hypothetical protein FDP41_010879 [Naegleria fowleri]CAG4709637.1 unnamed protein product [Naegleria fowleri]